MSDRGIIMGPGSISRLLDGRKTQTRRILREPMPPAPSADSIHPSNAGRKVHATPYFDAYCSARKTSANPRGMSDRWCWWTRDDRQCLPTIRIGYAPGDRLWVREVSSAYWPSHPAVAPTPGREVTSALIKQTSGGFATASAGEPVHVFYRADTEVLPWTHMTWRSARHMSRWASRLTLTVTDVRVQRLRDITEEDAEAEGADPVLVPPDGGSNPHVEGFRDLWNSLHGRRAWDRNPYVVAITFSVEQRNIDDARQ